MNDEDLPVVSNEDLRHEHLKFTRKHLKEILECVHAGPWQVNGVNVLRAGWREPPIMVGSLGELPFDDKAKHQNVADAQFIASCRNFLPDLLAEMDRMEKHIEKLEVRLDYKERCISALQTGDTDKVL
jgi:hypothetical protein